MVTVEERFDSRLVEQWVASLPIDGHVVVSSAGESAAEKSASSNEVPSRASSRKKSVFHGFQQQSGRPSNAADVYQLAMATRRARERHSVVSMAGSDYQHSNLLTAGERSAAAQDRAVMLRMAYAAQRPEKSQYLLPGLQPGGLLSNGTTATVSFDSSNFLDTGVPLDGDEEDNDDVNPAEELLFDLGFGGPSFGLDRIPQRFLQPSLMRGVDIDDLLMQQQSADPGVDTTLGYRGLSGPPTRRPSSIVARLFERMRENSVIREASRRKSSGYPSNFTSFEHSIGHVVGGAGQAQHSAVSPAKAPEALVEESHTPVDVPASVTAERYPHILVKSVWSSLASSRRSSLKRQECVDEDDTDEESPAAEQHQQHSIELAVECTEIVVPLDLCPAPQTVYVYTPPPSVDLQTAQCSVDAADTTPNEMDSILAVLQLAAEAYRVRLDQGPSPTAAEDSASPTRVNGWRDWNHNNMSEETDRVKDQLRDELDKTDRLLGLLKQRLMLGRSPANEQPVDSAAFRSILNDMTSLLQHQQQLYQRVTQLRQQEQAPDGSNAEDLLATRQSDDDARLRQMAPPSPDGSSPRSGKSEDDEDGHSSTGQCCPYCSAHASFENRLIASVRRAVRQELARRPGASSYAARSRYGARRSPSSLPTAKKTKR